jgi:hypothetical protein
MAQIREGSIVLSGDGNQSYIWVSGPQFLLDEIDFYCTGISAGNDSTEAHSYGHASANGQFAGYSIIGGSNGADGKCIWHPGNPSGSIITRLSASFVQAEDYGGGFYGFTINVPTGKYNVNIPVRYKAIKY